jgi:hypothetical protein
VNTLDSNKITYAFNTERGAVEAWYQLELAYAMENKLNSQHRVQREVPYGQGGNEHCDFLIDDEWYVELKVDRQGVSDFTGLMNDDYCKMQSLAGKSKACVIGISTIGYGENCTEGIREDTQNAYIFFYDATDPTPPEE